MWVARIEVPFGNPMQSPSHTGCLSLHGVSSLKQCLVQPVLVTTVEEQGVTREKSLQINRQLLFLLAPGIGQLGLLQVEPPLLSEAFKYSAWPAYGLGHS